MTSELERKPLPLGHVDRSQPHFALLYGSGDDDPRTWIEVAWIGGTDREPVAEIATELSTGGPDLRRRIEWQLSDALGQNPFFEGTVVLGFDANGELRPRWRTALEYQTGTARNLYGDFHWARRRGATV